MTNYGLELICTFFKETFPIPILLGIICIVGLIIGMALFSRNIQNLNEKE